MQWFKILRKFVSITTSTHHKSPILFCGYLGYLKSYKIGSVFKIFMWISVFRRKKWCRNLFIGSGDIKQTNIVAFFLKHPVADVLSFGPCNSDCMRSKNPFQIIFGAKNFSCFFGNSEYFKCIKYHVSVILSQRRDTLYISMLTKYHTDVI